MFILKLNTVVNNVAIKQVQKADSTNMYILFMTEFNINRHTEAMHVKKFIHVIIATTKQVVRAF